MLNRSWKPVAWIALGCAIGALSAWAITLYRQTQLGTAVASPLAPSSETSWAAAGPGRVEPRFGETKIVAPIAGRISRMLVHPRNDVAKGALLAELDNDEQQAKVRAAEAEVVFRQAERDNAVSGAMGSDRRAAEDAVAEAEREYEIARAERDRVEIARRSGKATDRDVQEATSAVAAAEARLGDARKALQVVNSVAGAAKPSRTESALAIARAELAVAQAALERTNIRAPYAGQIVQAYKTIGELVTPSADDPLFTLGDLTRLRVRVEVDERDIGHILLGQSAVVRADAFAGREFQAIVSFIAAATHPKRLATRSPGAVSNDGVLEVIIDITESTPLIPGMRVDAFFENSDAKTRRNISHAIQ